MLGDRGAADVEMYGDVTHGLRPLGQQLQDPPPRGIGDGAEDVL